MFHSSINSSHAKLSTSSSTSITALGAVGVTGVVGVVGALGAVVGAVGAVGCNGGKYKGFAATTGLADTEDETAGFADNGGGIGFDAGGAIGA